MKRSIFFDKESKRDSLRLNHANPLKQLKGLISTSPTHDISVSPAPTITSLDIIKDMSDLGCTVTGLTPSIYGLPRQSTRLLDNSDLLRGYDLLYESERHYRQVMSSLSLVIKDIRSSADSPRGLGLPEEMEDIDKISAQRTGIFQHLTIPVALRKLDKAHPEMETAIKDTLANYQRVLTKVSFEEGMLIDSDPFGTQTGMPLKARGDSTEQARIAMCLAAPSEVGPGFLDQLDRLWGIPLGLPPTAVYSSLLAHRQGPTRKETRLFYESLGCYVSDFTSKFLYGRLRNVFPAPYVLNFLMSVCYVQLSGCRKKILGLWHDPVHQQEYISRLRDQGKHIYAFDFSEMDKHITKYHVAIACNSAIELGFDSTGFTLLKDMFNNMGLLLPSFWNDTSTTFLTNYIPWPSGLKTTSEIDSIIGQALPMACIRRQNSKFYDLWKAGKVILLNQGDDVLISLPFELDTDRFQKDADELGFNIKVEPDSRMFLKTVLPLHGALKNPTRTWARVIQQQWLNEDDYSGKPPALMKIGCAARLFGIRNNPLFFSIWPKLFPILMTLNWAKDLTSSQMSELKRDANITLNNRDNEDILKYAEADKSWLSQMIARANYEPSAAQFMSFLEGVTNIRTLEKDSIKYASLMRKAQLKAFKIKPTAAAISNMFSLKEWERDRIVR